MRQDKLSFRQFLEEAGYIDPVPAPEPSPLQQIYDKLDANRKDILMHTAELLLNQMGEVTQFPDNDKIIDNIGKINWIYAIIPHYTQGEMLWHTFQIIF